MNGMPFKKSVTTSCILAIGLLSASPTVGTAFIEGPQISHESFAWSDGVSSGLPKVPAMNQGGKWKTLSIFDLYGEMRNSTAEEERLYKDMKGRLGRQIDLDAYFS